MAFDNLLQKLPEQLKIMTYKKWHPLIKSEISVQEICYVLVKDIAANQIKNNFKSK